MAITSMEITKKPISIPVTNGSTSQVSRVAKITEVPEALKQMVLTSTEILSLKAASHAGGSVSKAFAAHAVTPFPYTATLTRVPSQDWKLQPKHLYLAFMTQVYITCTQAH